MDDIYNKLVSFCKNSMKYPITVEELMDSIHCDNRQVVKDCINRLCSSGNGCIQLYTVTGSNNETAVEILWKKEAKTQMNCFSNSTSSMATTSRINQQKRNISKFDRNLVQQQIATLRMKMNTLDEEIAKLSTNYSEDDLLVFIEKLHQYNEIKDLGQMLLGKLAEVEGLPVKDLYPRFGLNMED